MLTCTYSDVVGSEAIVIAKNPFRFVKFVFRIYVGIAQAPYYYYYIYSNLNKVYFVAPKLL